MICKKLAFLRQLDSFGINTYRAMDFESTGKEGILPIKLILNLKRLIRMTFYQSPSKIFKKTNCRNARLWLWESRVPGQTKMLFEINTDILTLINVSVKFETRKHVNFLVKSYMFFLSFLKQKILHTQIWKYIYIYIQKIFVKKF